MQRVTDNVKARYRRKGLINSSSTWPPFHAQSFTHLALVHQKFTQLQAKKDTTKVARIRATGDIHKIPELTLSIKLDNLQKIFTPVTSDDQTHYAMSILIEGHPGIGKTTLAKEMCLQWANSQLLTSDKLVLLLMLRDPNVQKITSIEQLVKYTQSTDQVECVLSYLQNNNGVGVTLIIDGFDELSAELRQTSFFRKVIEGDILHNVRVVVTSRPSASACLHQHIHKRIEVLGFEKSSKEHYVDKALKDKPDCLHKLKTHFQQYPNVDALCYIPLNMAIIVYLCLLGSLPPTATKMYESFILHTICRSLKTAKKIPIDTSVTKIEDLPQSVCEVLQHLQKVAFDGLEKDKIIFTVKELPIMCKDDPTCFGLLQSTECYCAEEIGTSTQTFNFLHLGIQEFFAAKYVTTLPEDELYALLKESFMATQDKHMDANPDSKDVRLSNMWILYCGITSGQCKKLQHYLTTYGRTDSPNKSPSLMLSPTTSMKSQRFDSHPTKYDSSIVLPHSSHDYTLTSQANEQVNSNFDRQSMSGPSQLSHDQRISSIVSISKDVLKDPVKVLFLFQCFQEAQDNALCEILSKSFESDNKAITVINTSGHTLLPHNIVSLGFFLSKLQTKYKYLDLSACSIGDQGISILHQYLCGNKANKQKIKYINLSCNNLTGASLHLIADIINHLQPYQVNTIVNENDIPTAFAISKLIMLDMSFNNITGEGTIAISDMMICLKQLYIRGNKLGDRGAELLSKGITNTKTLKVLNMANNSIGTSGITTLANALANNTSLEELHMNGFFGRNGVIALANAIANNKKLKLLSLYYEAPIDDSYALDEESAMIIIRSLYKNNTITELYLDIELCEKDINDVTGEAENVNIMRRSHNEDIIKFHLDFYTIQDDIKDVCILSMDECSPIGLLKLLNSYVTS